MATAIYNGVSDSAVRAATGKGWDEWFAILDQAEAHTWQHPQIARYLAEEQGAPDWWAQMVTVGFEQARGLRAPGQKADGFTASASRTLNAPLEVVFAAWTDEGRRASWLPDAAWTVTKATANKSLRILWVDGVSRLDVEFRNKAETKSQVALQHSKLPDAEAAAEYKTFWGEAMDRLHQFVENEQPD
jgi:uncharacterized protein YndB with AHSA1/START domain